MYVNKSERKKENRVCDSELNYEWRETSFNVDKTLRL